MFFSSGLNVLLFVPISGVSTLVCVFMFSSFHSAVYHHMVTSNVDAVYDCHVGKHARLISYTNRVGPTRLGEITSVCVICMKYRILINY